MAEHHPKTDLEVRFEMFKKQYHDRQAEAKRTGKPIPAHTQRWGSLEGFRLDRHAA